ncbi:hypothetical protein GCM10028826_36750 [Mucilaginibacter boryungensis]
MGNFKTTYLYAQADYFRAGHFTIKELLLADSTQYAFNEYLQFVIELGLAGFVLIICFYSLMFIIIKKAIQKKSSQLLLICISLFIALTIAACFSYVFHIAIFAAIYIACSTYIACFTLTKGWTKSILIAVSVISVAAIWINNYSLFIFHSNALEKFKEANELGQAGYKSEAYQKMDSLYEDLKDYQLYLETFGNLALQQGYPQKALTAFQQQKKRKLYYNLFANIGDCYNKLNQKSEAEKNYQLAVNMVPNRFVSRYRLFEFYLYNNEPQKALIVGKGILHLPAKIPSAQVNHIKSIVQIKLNQLK